MLNILDFGAPADGASDSHAAIALALTTAWPGAVVWVPDLGVPFVISGRLDIPSDVQLLGPGTISALSSFGDDMMFTMSERAVLGVRVIDGTGMPTPSGAWTGAGSGLARSPVGVAVFINGASGAKIADCRICVERFQNFPSGAICAFYADRLEVQVRFFDDCQTHTSSETAPVVGAFNSAEVQYLGGTIDGYNWKGWAFASCSDALAVRCRAKDGATGHASHYDNASTRCGFVECSHDGSSGGDGYKGFLATAPYVRGFRSNASTGTGVSFDGCTDAELDGLYALDPANAGVYLSAEGGTLRGARVRNWRVDRTTQGTTVNHVGVKIVPSASNTIDGFDIDDGETRNGLYGISSLQVTGATVDGRIGANITYRQSAQYDVIGYFRNIFIAGGRIIRSAESGSDVYVFVSTQSSISGQTARFGALDMVGAGSDDVFLEVAGTWDTVVFDGPLSRGGGKLVRAAAGSAIKNLFLYRGTGYDAGQSTAVDLNFNQALTTRLIVRDLQLPTAAGAERFLGVSVSGSAALEGWGVETLTDAATIAVNPHNGEHFEITLGGNRTVGAPSNPTEGQRIAITVIQDGTGGRTLAWNAVFKQSWSNSGNTANLRSTISFIYDGTNWNQVAAQSPYA